MTSLKKLAISAAMILLAAPIIHADTIWIGSGKSSIKATGIKVLQASGDSLQYTTDAGTTASKELSQLSQINIDGATIFNTAENAFAAGDYDTAISNYQQVLQSSGSKGWMQARAAARLLAAGKVKNRFDAQVDAYIALLQKDPTTAAKNKPVEPSAHSPYLDPALTSISRALDSASIADPQKKALLSLQLQIDQAKDDTAAVNSTLQQLVAMGGATDSDKAQLKVLAAGVAYQDGKYDQAISDIDQNRALISDPDQQVDALFILAQSKDKLNGDKTDPDTLKDLALNYMRVVTFGSLLPDRPHVPESLYAAGQLEEKLKEPQAALQLYKQIVNDRAYANSPVLPLAKAASEKLAAAK